MQPLPPEGFQWARASVDDMEGVVVPTKPVPNKVEAAPGIDTAPPVASEAVPVTGPVVAVPVVAVPLEAVPVQDEGAMVSIATADLTEAQKLRLVSHPDVQVFVPDRLLFAQGVQSPSTASPDVPEATPVRLHSIEADWHSITDERWQRRRRDLDEPVQESILSDSSPVSPMKAAGPPQVFTKATAASSAALAIGLSTVAVAARASPMPRPLALAVAATACWVTATTARSSAALEVQAGGDDPSTQSAAAVPADAEPAEPAAAGSAAAKGTPAPAAVSAPLQFGPPPEGFEVRATAMSNPSGAFQFRDEPWVL